VPFAFGFGVSFKASAAIGMNEPCYIPDRCISARFKSVIIKWTQPHSHSGRRHDGFFVWVLEVGGGMENLWSSEIGNWRKKPGKNNFEQLQNKVWKLGLVGSFVFCFSP